MTATQTRFRHTGSRSNSLEDCGTRGLLGLGHNGLACHAGSRSDGFGVTALGLGDVLGGRDRFGDGPGAFDLDSLGYTRRSGVGRLG